jgi:hypothetical protein
MSFYPKLLAILAMLLPPGSGEASEPIVLGSSAVLLAVRGQQDSFPVFSPAHLPSPTESFFERLDETALDEEDSTRVEDHGIVPLTFLDFESPLTSDLFSSLFPVSPHAHLVVITPILRC